MTLFYHGNLRFPGRKYIRHYGECSDDIQRYCWKRLETVNIQTMEYRLDGKYDGKFVCFRGEVYSEQNAVLEKETERLLRDAETRFRKKEGSIVKTISEMIRLRKKLKELREEQSCLA